jgi:hypothetical protein
MVLAKDKRDLSNSLSTLEFDSAQSHICMIDAASNIYV